MDLYDLNPSVAEHPARGKVIVSGSTRIYRGPDHFLSPSSIPRKSLFSFLLPINDAHAEETAYIDSSPAPPLGSIITRGQTQHLARAIAYGLRLQLSTFDNTHGADLLNVPRYGTVLMFAGNSIAVPLAVLGAIAGGITVSMASSALGPPELAYQIKDSVPSHVLASPELVPTVVAAFKLLGITADEDIRRRIIVLAFKKELAELEDAQIKTELARRRLMDLNDVIRTDRELFPEAFDAEDADRTVMMFYSSGTTGLPKGVELSHYNLVANLVQVPYSPLYFSFPRGASGNGAVSTNPQDHAILGVMPHYHVYGGVALLFLPLRIHSPSIILRKFEPVSYLKCIQKWRPTMLYIAPPVAAFLTESPLFNHYDVSCVRMIVSSAAALSPNIVEALRKRIDDQKIRKGRRNDKVYVAQAFGATEMSPGVSYVPFGFDTKPGSSGVLLAGIEGRVVDPDSGYYDKNGRWSPMVDVKEGARGELILRGPNRMKGYFNKPEATAKTIVEDGWLRSGDVVQFDSDGWFTVVDRIKEFMKYKGYQVSPVEVENVLLTHPQVLDVAVAGVKEARTGDEPPRAYIVPRDPALLRPGAKFEPDVYQWVQDRLAHYKQLRGGVYTIPAVPKSPAGKMLRRELRDRAAKDIAAGRDGPTSTVGTYVPPPKGIFSRKGKGVKESSKL
ncbi:acetyl-CoA synthetase-like protein [Clavulina sp. PMI_390]|nr:acetyl-CoA synthetase-like protein [Clavulina sp. PMI_390]